MTDIVLRMKTLPDLTNEQAWGVVYEGAREIERLRAALSDLCRAYVRLMEAGRDRIIDLGGTCDTLEKMETGDPYLIAAKAALQPL